MVGIENEHGGLFFYRLVCTSDFPTQAEYLVEFRIVLERSRNGIDPIRLRLKVPDVRFQIGKFLLYLDKPPFEGRRIGHDCLHKHGG